MQTREPAAPVFTPRKRTISQLQGEVVLWANRLPVGSEWKHWSGPVFEITGHGVNVETGQVEVQFKEAKIGKAEPLLYAVGSSVPVNLPVILHRPAEDWEKEVTVHGGQVMPADVVRSLTSEQKLYVANERRTLPRYKRVQRVEQFVEITR